MFSNYEQDNWSEMLPMCEYAYNNSVTTATGLSPFYTNYGFHPRTNWPVEAEVKNPASHNYAHWMTSVHKWCHKALEDTREKMGKYHDKKSKDAPKYKEGQFVVLNGKNIKTRRPSRKLNFKGFGPFKILKVISPTAVRVELPKHWRIYNTFYVLLLEPYRESARGLRSSRDLDQAMEDMDDMDLDNETMEDDTDWEIDEVMASSCDKN